MASCLRPRRGKKATAESQNFVLKRGEVFFEVPTTGVGTGIGKIKIGDGTTAYKNLPYFLELEDYDIGKDENGMTVHEKLDMILAGGASSGGGTAKVLYFRSSTNGTTKSETVVNNSNCTAEFSVICKSAISPKLYVNGAVASTIAGVGTTASKTLVNLKKGDSIYIEITGSSHDSITMVSYMG